MKKNLIFIFPLTALLILAIYFFLIPGSTYYEKKALECFIHNDYVSTEKNLSLAQKKSNVPCDISYAYIAQVKGNYNESDRLFLLAINKSQNKLDPNCQLEIFLSKAANAYFQNKIDEMQKWIKAANQIDGNYPLLSFYKGLSSYIEERYDEAFIYWSRFKHLQTEKCSDWIIVSFEQLFPYSWRQIHLAHCMLETGDFSTSRGILENENHQLGGHYQDLNNLAALFLGLSYLNESKTVPLEQRSSFYKLSRFYFDHVGKKECFSRERNRVAGLLLSEAEFLLLNEVPEEHYRFGFSFIHILQEWQANALLEKLADQIATRIAYQKGSKMICFCKSVRQEFQKTPFHAYLTENLLSSLTCGIKNGEKENLFELWELVESLSSSPKSLANQIAFLTTEELFKTIEIDQANLSQTRHYLNFWHHLGCGNEESDRMGLLLFGQSQLFWNREGNENKGLQLLEIALETSHDKNSLKEKIELFLVNLYTHAEESNLIARLSLIYDAMNRFGIERNELVTSEKIANHLADADYLYKAHRYNSAMTLATWILKLDPNSEKAMEIAGLASFHLGDYTNAVAVLKKISQPSEQAQKILILSEVFSTQQQNKHIAQNDYCDSFDEE